MPGMGGMFGEGGLPGMPPGGPGGPCGPGGPGGPGGPRGGFGSMNPYGAMGGGYDQGSQRIEKAIEYIPLEELDKAIEKGKVPATTVIPLRMVLINAEVPYKRQLEEIKRALRIP